jgi:hypothetical protein
VLCEIWTLDNRNVPKDEGIGIDIAESLSFLKLDCFLESGNSLFLFDLDFEYLVGTLALHIAPKFEQRHRQDGCKAKQVI